MRDEIAPCGPRRIIGVSTAEEADECANASGRMQGLSSRAFRGVERQENPTSRSHIARTLSAVVTEGMRAISVRINDVLGVTGFVLPGDRVDIMLTRRDQGGQSYTDLLLQSVKVLAIDERADKHDVAKTVTLEADTEDAQKLVLAQTIGTISLALRKAGNRTPSLSNGRSFAAPNCSSPYTIMWGVPYDNETKFYLTKCGGTGDPMLEPRTARAKPSLIDPNAIVSNARIGVSRGMKIEEYRVPKDELPELE